MTDKDIISEFNNLNHPHNKFAWFLFHSTQEIKDYIHNRYNDSNSDKESLQRILNNIDNIPTCPICGNKNIYIGRPNRIYSKYCCNECKFKDIDLVERHKQGCLKKYGVENISQVKEIKEKKEKIPFTFHPTNKGFIAKKKIDNKEKIKKIKANVDVLTLSATPIPRTLQMSMTGIRSLALIETPPKERYPIQTYVLEESDLVIKDAIYKELSRDGQVFILYNSVEHIQDKLIEISRLVPEAKIDYAHGKMTKEQLENKMNNFINGKFNVLLCTTIIETGIDIPNVNTLIIIDADRFGLSQLYQIRGRIGRSNKIGYAYLMYGKHKFLNDIAIKRLDTIKEFTELGSGFKIAMRDLSIRGAGDILGREQSGFIDTVGIDLYLKMLNEEIKKAKGEEVINSSNDNDATKDKPLISVSTHIDDKYVSDMDLKIIIHKKINQVDCYNKFCEIKEELEDRFGKLSDDLIIYMYEEWFEKLAKSLKIVGVDDNSSCVILTLNNEMSSKVKGDELFMETYRINKNFRLNYKNGCINIILDKGNLEQHYLIYLIGILIKLKEMIKEK